MANQPPHNPAPESGVAADAVEAWPLGAAVAGRWQGSRSLQARPALVSSGAVERRERWLAQLGGAASQPFVHTPLADALAQALAEAPLLLGKLGVMSRTLSIADLADLVQLVLEEEVDGGPVEHEGALAAAESRSSPKTAHAAARKAGAGQHPRRIAAASTGNRQALAAVRGALRSLAHRQALAAVSAVSEPASLAAAGQVSGAAAWPPKSERGRVGVGGSAVPEQAVPVQAVPEQAVRDATRQAVQPAPRGERMPAVAESGHSDRLYAQQGLLGSLLRAAAAGAGPSGRSQPARHSLGQGSHSQGEPNLWDAAALRPLGLAGRAARAWGLSWLGREVGVVRRASAPGLARDAADALYDAVWLALSHEAEVDAVASGAQMPRRPAAVEASGRPDPDLASWDDRAAVLLSGQRTATGTSLTSGAVEPLPGRADAQSAAARMPWTALSGPEASAPGVVAAQAAARTRPTPVYASESGSYGRQRAAAWGPVAAAFAAGLAERWLTSPGLSPQDNDEQRGGSWAFAQSGGAAAGLDYLVPADDGADGALDGPGRSAAAEASSQGRSNPGAGPSGADANRQAAQVGAAAVPPRRARIRPAQSLYAPASRGDRSPFQRWPAAATFAGESASGPLAFAQPAAAAAVGSAQTRFAAVRRRGAGLGAIAAAAGLLPMGAAAAQLAHLARTSPLWKRWTGRSNWTEMSVQSTTPAATATLLEQASTLAGASGGGLAGRLGGGADAGALTSAAAVYGTLADADRALLTLADDVATPDSLADVSASGRDALSGGAGRPLPASQRASSAPLADQPPAALRAALQALGLASRAGGRGAAGEFAAAWLGQTLPAAASARALAGRETAASTVSTVTDRAALDWVQPGGLDSAGQVSPDRRVAPASAAGQRSHASGEGAVPGPAEPGLLQLQGFAALAALGLPPAEWAALAPAKTLGLAADGGRGELLASSPETVESSTAGAGEPKTAANTEISTATSGQAAAAARSGRPGATRSGVLGFVPAGLRASRNLLSWDRRAAAWNSPQTNGERWQSRRFGQTVRRGSPRLGNAQARPTAGGWGLDQVGALLALGDTAEGGYFGEALAGPGQAAAAEALHGAVAARRGATMLRGHAGAVARQSAAAGAGRVGDLPTAYGDLPADFSAERALLQPASAAAASAQAAGQRGGATAAGQATKAAGMARVLSVTSQPAANTLPLVAPMAQAMVQVAAAKPLSESVVTSGADPTMALPQTGGAAAGSERGRGDTAQQAGAEAAAAQDVDALAQKIARSVMVRLKRERERRGLYG